MMVNQQIVLKIGIASPEVQRQRVLDIAAGRRKRAEGEPRVWFPSLKTAAEVLDRNRELIRVICDESPGSVTELALRVGRKESNVSRSLKRLEAFGIVRLLDEGRSRRPIALARDFEIQVSC
ncbi:MAG: transcriptional regulator [Chromatiaceae bacterium]|nr:transcriptional regulator [Candidatus Thioaporhodococcus sediminis]